jgi:hypothetical protein
MLLIQSILVLPLLATPQEVMFVETFQGFRIVDPQTGQVIHQVVIEDPSVNIYGMTHDGARLIVNDRGTTFLRLSCTFSGSALSVVVAEPGGSRAKSKVERSELDARGEDTRLRVSKTSTQAPPCARQPYSDLSSASSSLQFATSTSVPRASSWTCSLPGRSPAAGSAGRSAARCTTPVNGTGDITTWRA